MFVSGAVHTFASAEQPDGALSQHRTKNKRRAQPVMDAEQEDILIDWIRETPFLYQKDFEIIEIQRREVNLNSTRSMAPMSSIAQIKMNSNILNCCIILK